MASQQTLQVGGPYFHKEYVPLHTDVDLSN